MELADTHYTQFTNNSLNRDVLLDYGERRETCDPENTAPIPSPTKETVPQHFLIMGVGIVHKLWKLLRSEGSMVHSRGTILVIELDGA